MFEGVVLADTVKNLITKAIENSTLSHAIILEGSSESVRMEVAKTLAMAILCKGENKPCKNCSSCLKIRNSSHPDLKFLSRRSDKNSIVVDDIRNVKEQALVYPNDGDKSVFIITEAQEMNVQAQNALLKIFEEPAEHICFILTCNSKSSLLQTIISRATCYFLGDEEKKEDLKSEQAKELAKELFLCLVAENEFQFLKKTVVFSKDKKLFKAVLEESIPIIRDVLFLHSGSKALISGSEDVARKLKGGITQKKTMRIFEELQNLLDCVDASANHNLSITRFSAVLCSIVKG